MARRARLWTNYFVFMAVGILLVSSPARAQWSATGATAVVDEGSAGSLVMNDTGSISLRSGLVGSAQVRWPLMHVPGLDDEQATAASPYSLCLFVRVRDQGSADQVVIRVRELTDGDGTMRTLATWDSDTAVDFAGTPFEMEGNTAYRTGVVCPLRRSGTEIFGLDWRFRTYYVDATLKRAAASGNPGIMLVKVYPVQ